MNDYQKELTVEKCLLVLALVLVLVQIHQAVVEQAELEGCLEQAELEEGWLEEGQLVQLEEGLLEEGQAEGDQNQNQIQDGSREGQDADRSLLEDLEDRRLGGDLHDH